MGTDLPELGQKLESAPRYGQNAAWLLLKSIADEEAAHGPAEASQCAAPAPAVRVGGDKDSPPQNRVAVKPDMALFEAVPRPLRPNIAVSTKHRPKIPRAPRITWLNRAISLYLRYIGVDLLNFESKERILQETRFNATFCRCAVAAATAHEAAIFEGANNAVRYQNHAMYKAASAQYVPRDAMQSLCAYYNVSVPSELVADDGEASARLPLFQPASMSAPTSAPPTSDSVDKPQSTQPAASGGSMASRATLPASARTSASGPSSAAHARKSAALAKTAPSRVGSQAQKAEKGRHARLGSQCAVPVNPLASRPAKKQPESSPAAKRAKLDACRSKSAQANPTAPSSSSASGPCKGDEKLIDQLFASSDEEQREGSPSRSIELRERTLTTGTRCNETEDIGAPPDAAEATRVRSTESLPAQSQPRFGTRCDEVRPDGAASEHRETSAHKAQLPPGFDTDSSDATKKPRSGAEASAASAREHAPATGSALGTVLQVQTFVGQCLEKALGADTINLKQYTEILGRVVEKVVDAQKSEGSKAGSVPCDNRIRRLVDKYIEFVVQRDKSSTS